MGATALRRARRSSPRGEVAVRERGMLNGAEVILELLRTQGTDCIFASPIVMAPLWEALAQRLARGEEERPRYLQCRHESLAVSLASGYYKATARPQVVFLPTGLGVLHGAMALRTALQERVPMTVLSPDTLTYGDVPELDPGPEWASLLIEPHTRSRVIASSISRRCYNACPRSCRRLRPIGSGAGKRTRSARSSRDAGRPTRRWHRHATPCRPRRCFAPCTVRCQHRRSSWTRSLPRRPR